MIGVIGTNNIIGGVPTAPTASTDDESTAVATTQYVINKINESEEV